MTNDLVTGPRRFRNNAFVTGGFGVRFYVGTPLVASDGHRLGTLCFADAAPRKFDAERCNILNNMAELVVRELERAWALRQTRMEAAQMQQARALLPSGWQAGLSVVYWRVTADCI